MSVARSIKHCVFLVLALTLFNCSRQSRTKVPAQLSEDPLFVWDRPTSMKSITTNHPIVQSATCRMKKTSSVIYQSIITGAELDAPGRIYYRFGEEDESDTVAFINLNLTNPIVQSNGGQATLEVVHDDGEILTLLNAQPSGVETYTIFKSKGVVVYSQQKKSLVGHPWGVLAMGYCE